MTDREQAIWTELDSLYAEQAGFVGSHRAGQAVAEPDMEAWAKRSHRIRELEDELWVILTV